MESNMNYYLIKYTGNLWSVERMFTQQSSAEEYKSRLDKRNTSTAKYMVVVCPHIQGDKHLPKFVEYQLSKQEFQHAA
jgi:hypothetical protein